MASKGRLPFAAAVLVAVLSPAPAGGTAPGPPQTTITAGPEGLVHEADVAFGFGSDDAAAEFQCRLDGGVWTPRPRAPRHVFDDSWRPCAAPAVYRHMEDGRHLFEVRAVGSGGIVDPTPAVREFEIDTNVAGYVQAKRVQDQPADRIRINVRLTAAEPVEAEVGGTIAVGPGRGRAPQRFELLPRRARLGSDGRRRLRLAPLAGERRLLRRLRRGHRASAHLNVRFTNEHGNSSAYRLRIVIRSTESASAQSVENPLVRAPLRP